MDERHEFRDQRCFRHRDAQAIGTPVHPITARDRHANRVLALVAQLVVHAPADPGVIDQQRRPARQPLHHEADGGDNGRVREAQRKARE
jgi:hypothetical protein